MDARVGEPDVIRGVALSGVRWMNLYEGPSFIPPDRVIALAPSRLDTVLSHAGGLLMTGKAQPRLSMLVGCGFTLLLDRATAILRRMPVFLGHDDVALVHEPWRGLVDESYLTPVGPASPDVARRSCWRSDGVQGSRYRARTPDAAIGCADWLRPAGWR